MVTDIRFFTELKKEGPPKPKPLYEMIADVQEETIDCLWKNRIPRGKLTLFDGDPGVGKSTLALAIAASLSNGHALPFDTEPEAPLKSLIISAEDNPADTIKPRLSRLSADQNMIAIPKRDLNLTPKMITANFVDQILSQIPAAFLVIDPIIAYSNGRNTDRSSETRDLLQPFVAIADKHKTAIILVRHLTKGEQSKALYRGQGSNDFVAVARSAFMFFKDANDPDRRLMTHYKCSFSTESPSLEYFIDHEGSFRWGSETTDTADQLASSSKERPSEQLDKAVQFLKTQLSNGPKSSNYLKKYATQADIAWRTLWRAKDSLSLKVTKSRDTGEWFWHLP